MLTKLTLIFISIAAILIGCNSSDDNPSQVAYERFKTEIAVDSFSTFAVDLARYIAQNDNNIVRRNEAKSWLISYDRRTIQNEERRIKEKGEIQDRINSIGGYKLHHIDKGTKCNMTTGFFILNKRITDPKEAEFLSRHLAVELFGRSVKEKDCPYKLMTSALIYQPGEYRINNDIGEWVAMCTISPANYSGEVSVNNFKLK